MLFLTLMLGLSIASAAIGVVTLINYKSSKRKVKASAKNQAEPIESHKPQVQSPSRHLQAEGQTEVSNIRQNVLRMKERLEVRLENTEEKGALEMKELVAEVSAGIFRHLADLSSIEDRLPSALLSGDPQGFEALEEKRAEHLKKIRDACEVLVETSEILKIPYRPPPLPDRHAPTTSEPPTSPFQQALEQLRAENSVARRVREFMDEDLLLDTATEFLDHQDSAQLEDFTLDS